MSWLFEEQDDCEREQDHTWECCSQKYDMCIWCGARIACREKNA